jgi:uncharacterized membrane protein YraQ (UPF0718 family)
MQQDGALQVAMSLPTWLIVFLLWSSGAMCATIVAMIMSKLKERAVDTQITGARTAVEAAIALNQRNQNQIDATHNDRLRDLENLLTGVDGQNGMRSVVRETGRAVRALMTVVRRMAEAASIDTKEIDAINQE